MTDNYSIWIDKQIEILKAKTFCCPEMRRIRIDAFGADFNIDWDDKTMDPFGTYEADKYEDCPKFEILYCMFCGAKLE